MKRKYRIEVNNREYEVTVASRTEKEDNHLVVEVDGETYNVIVEKQTEITSEKHPGIATTLQEAPMPKAEISQTAKSVGEKAIIGVVKAPIPGTVLEVKTEKGEKVTAGQTLLVLEAMKMRNEIYAPVEGTVVEIVSTGTRVAYSDLLARIE